MSSVLPPTRPGTPASNASRVSTPPRGTSPIWQMAALARNLGNTAKAESLEKTAAAANRQRNSINAKAKADLVAYELKMREWVKGKGEPKPGKNAFKKQGIAFKQPKGGEAIIDKLISELKLKGGKTRRRSNRRSNRTRKN